MAQAYSVGQELTVTFGGYPLRVTNVCEEHLARTGSGELHVTVYTLT